MSEQGMPAGQVSETSFATASARLAREGVVDICAGIAVSTFCANTGTPYYRLQHRRAIFDEVAALNVEALNKSAIARVKQIAWNTVARWLEKAAHSCRRFNDRRITTLAIAELQADEIRTIIGSNEQPISIFTTIDILPNAVQLVCHERAQLLRSAFCPPLHAGRTCVTSWSQNSLRRSQLVHEPVHQAGLRLAARDVQSVGHAGAQPRRAHRRYVLVAVPVVLLTAYLHR